MKLLIVVEQLTDPHMRELMVKFWKKEWDKRSTSLSLFSMTRDCEQMVLQNKINREIRVAGLLPPARTPSEWDPVQAIESAMKLLFLLSEPIWANNFDGYVLLGRAAEAMMIHDDMRPHGEVFPLIEHNAVIGPAFDHTEERQQQIADIVERAFGV